MTKKTIKASDVLGENYYTYELTSSNYTPTLNGTITITCTMKDVYGIAAGSKSITLYQNGTSKGAKTTNSSGVATWSITCSTAGLQKFNIKDTSIEVFVDNKSDVGHTHSQYLTEHQSLANYVTTSDSRLSDARTPTSHTHGNLQNNGQVGSTAQANKNVVTNSSGLITTEDKPTIPSKTSQLTNDSGFLTSHQSLDSKTVTVEKLATAESGYLSSYVVKQNGTQVGNTINIPKDFLVKSGSVKTVSTANNPVSGYSVGDKYIDLVINVKEGTDTDSHIYILVSDLVDTPVTISDVTGLQTALNGKANSSHTHNTTEIRDSSAYNRIGSSVNDTQANINNSIDIALAGLDDNILYTKMDLIGLGEFQVKDFINPNNWKSSGCTYSDGVLTFLGSNSFTATFPTDFELSFDYIIDHGLGLGDTIYFDIFGHETQYIVTEDDYNNGYAIIDVSFKSENNIGSITSEASGDEWHINNVGSLNPYTISAINPDGISTKIANIRYKANDIISLNDNKEDVYNKVTSLSSSSTDTQYPSAKCVYDTANSKIEKDHKIVTTFSVSDYVDTSFATWNNENTITMTQNSFVEINLKQALYEIGDYIEFIITALTGTFSLKDEDDYEICSGSTKINIEKITNSTCTVKTYHNTTLIHTETNYPLSNLLWIIYSTGCTVNFNTKKYYHTVSLIDRIYPIGSIYMSVNDINPSLFIGGTWEQIKDKFLLSVGDTYANGSTGGEATHILTTNEMPSHTHTQNAHTHTQAQHRHAEHGNWSSGSGSDSGYMYNSNRSVSTQYTGYATPTINDATATNQNTGGGQAHNNMPPYLAVYMWKRTA